MSRKAHQKRKTERKYTKTGLRKLDRLMLDLKYEWAKSHPSSPENKVKKRPP